MEQEDFLFIFVTKKYLQLKDFFARGILETPSFLRVIERLGECTMYTPTSQSITLVKLQLESVIQYGWESKEWTKGMCIGGDG